MVGYAALGVELKYLIAASFMAAPGGLLMAKLMVPEQQVPNDELQAEGLEEQKYTNIFDAATSGASAGMQIAMNVGAMLLAFIALIAMINGLLGWLGSLFGYDALTLELTLGYVFQPVAYLIGVPWHEANIAGSFIGQKVVINEFVAYQDFVSQKDALSAQSQVVITFALCGFANLSSIAILMGGLGQMAPKIDDKI